MKTKVHLLTVAYVLLLTIAVRSTADELERCEEMTRFLREKGIAGFVAKASDPGWRVPVMPSAWNVNQVAIAEKRPELRAARTLGSALLDELDKLATDVRKTGEEEELHRLVEICLSSAEWSWGGARAGYCNVLLAHRSLDIAAVGLAKMLVTNERSLERLSAQVVRLREPWTEPASRARLLNFESGTGLFQADSVQAVWGAGRILGRLQVNPRLGEELASIVRDAKRWDTPELREHRAFFEDDDLPGLRPLTTRRVWDAKWHQRSVEGFGLRSVVLSDFLKAVGRFPVKPEEEAITAEQKRSIELEKADLAKRGIELSKHESFYSSPQAAAFDQAWKRYLRRKDAKPGLPYNLDGEAWQAFDQVKHAAFWGEDETMTRHAEDQNP
jgi:hypothetical protein